MSDTVIGLVAMLAAMMWIGAIWLATATRMTSTERAAMEWSYRLCPELRSRWAITPRQRERIIEECLRRYGIDPPAGGTLRVFWISDASVELRRLINTPVALRGANAEEGYG